MLRLVSSARSRLLRVGGVRVAAVAVTPKASRLAVSTDPFHLRCVLPRFVSSLDAERHDRPKWKALAVNNPVAWQEAVKPSLLKFLKLNKHLMVPVMFVVPHGDEAWPKAAWGYRLGRHAAWLRKRWREGKIDPKQREELDELEFAWDTTQCKWDRFVLPSLRRFYELKGHTDVPLKFRVPRSSDWPELLWDQYLGSTVKNMRHRGDFVDQVKADQDELERLNFCVGLVLSSYSPRERVAPAIPGKDLSLTQNDPEWKWNEQLMPAFGAFHRLHGHCRVPRAFVVPSDECWPTPSWGLKLGSVVNHVRSQGRFSTQVTRDKDRLAELGFVWDIYEFKWSERIMPALETFRRLRGHCRVPIKFVVPQDENWPRLSWGLNLGYVVDAIRQGSYFSQVLRDKTRLKEMGFVWDFYKAEWIERVLPALETFYQLRGHCRVPRYFQVPADASWPTESHGLKLGSAVINIRNRGSYFDWMARSMDALEAIEFDSMTPVTKKWEERVEPMLATFEQLHGHRNVPRDFVVPSRSPWDEKDWGIQLGKLERNE